MLAFSGITFFFSAYAQTDSALTISGSVDGYYRYNFANAKDLMETNSYTSFTSSHNSFELGMASVKFAYSKGKVGAVADLGFGTRANEFSYNETGALAAIKQGYVWYAPSDKVKFSMGKWATHLGYELVDPQLNRNYSMSYMFSYGPFSHTALKVDFTLNGGFGIMLGVSNPTDYLSAPFAKKNIIAQVSKTSDNFNAYLNYVGGEDLGDNMINQFGLTATAKISDKFGIGYDGTVKSVNPEVGSTESWFGSALYLNFDPSDKFGITARGEYFSDKKGVAGFGTSIFDATLSFNIKPVSNLMIIPEFRVDAAKDPIYFKSSDTPILPTAKSTGTFNLAAIVSF
jgi:Putative beta-barrel porin-2, OmpL-like. bbp2